MIECWAAEYARIDACVGQLLEEADPRFCTETFKEWLVQWGAPDPCLELWGGLTAAGLVPDVLRTALVQKISEPTGNSPGFFTRLAKGYGYDITIFDRTHAFHVMSYITDPIEAKVPPHNWYVFFYEGDVAQDHRHGEGTDRLVGRQGHRVSVALVLSSSYGLAHRICGVMLYGFNLSKQCGRVDSDETDWPEKRWSSDEWLEVRRLAGDGYRDLVVFHGHARDCQRDQGRGPRPQWRLRRPTQHGHRSPHQEGQKRNHAAGRRRGKTPPLSKDTRMRLMKRLPSSAPSPNAFVPIKRPFPRRLPR